MQYVFLSHDVDWRREGPSKKHILDRKDRFSSEVINSLDEKNPYYNFPEYMEIEESMGVRSTFFFRTMYENGNYLDYENEISALIKGGWEIGLHLDPTSVNDFAKIRSEKINLEKLTKNKIIGNRVHFLKYDEGLTAKLQELGFVYDSSIRYSKDKIDENEMGFTKKNGIYEFPITWMDAYMFAYMKIKEDELVSIFKKTLDFSRKLGKDNILTWIWHDNILKMKGGRKYGEILEFLVSQDDVKILPGRDIINILK